MDKDAVDTMINQNNRKILLFTLFAVMIVAIILLASSLPGLRLKPGEPLNLLSWILAELASEDLFRLPEYEMEAGESGIWEPVSDTLRVSIIVIFWLTLVFSVIYAVVSPEFRRELVRIFMLVLTMAVLLPYIARRMTEQFNPLEGEESTGQFPSGEVAFPEPPQFVQQPPEWFLWVAEALLLLTIIAGIYFLWRYLRPRRNEEAVVAKHVQKALSELDSGKAFEDVVIACYQEMCQELQQKRQVRRQGYMTPREFENYLAEEGISDEHIRQLTRLFEGARYGAKPSDAGVESRARQNLQAILNAYGK